MIEIQNINIIAFLYFLAFLLSPYIDKWKVLIAHSFSIDHKYSNGHKNTHKSLQYMHIFYDSKKSEEEECFDKKFNPNSSFWSIALRLKRLFRVRWMKT